jgi:hypothetical protein
MELPFNEIYGLVEKLCQIGGAPTINISSAPPLSPRPLLDGVWITNP